MRDKKNTEGHLPKNPHLQKLHVIVKLLQLFQSVTANADISYENLLKFLGKNANSFPKEIIIDTEKKSIEIKTSTPEYTNPSTEDPETFTTNPSLFSEEELTQSIENDRFNAQRQSEEHRVAMEDYVTSFNEITSNISESDKEALTKHHEAFNAAASSKERGLAACYNKYLNDGHASSLLREFFKLHKDCVSAENKALSALKEALSEDTYARIETSQRIYLDAIKQSEPDTPQSTAQEVEAETTTTTTTTTTTAAALQGGDRAHPVAGADAVAPSPVASTENATNTHFHPLERSKYHDIYLLLRVLKLFKSFTKESDFTFDNFSNFLLSKKALNLESNTTITGTTSDLNDIISNASESEKKSYSNYFEHRDDEISKTQREMKGIHKKYIQNGNLNAFFKEIFESYKHIKLTDDRNLSNLRETVSEDFFKNIKNHPVDFPEAVKKHAADKAQAIHTPGTSGDNNPPMKESCAEENTGAETTTTVASADSGEQDANPVEEANALNPLQAPPTPANPLPFEQAAAGDAATQNATIATSAIPAADSDADPIGYAMPLLIAGAGAGVLIHAWQQGWLSDYLPDVTLVDIVAAVIGFDPFH